MTLGFIFNSSVTQGLNGATLLGAEMAHDEDKGGWQSFSSKRFYSAQMMNPLFYSD